MNLSSPPNSRKTKTAKIALFVLLVAGAGYWYFTKPSEEALNREKICKHWDYTDDASLNRCRNSDADMNAVITPRYNAAMRKQINDFNLSLAAISKNQTSTDVSGYEHADIAAVSKAIGSIMPIWKKPRDEPLLGKRLVVEGQIVTDTPQPEDEEGGEASPKWKPRTYSLWGVMPKGKNAMLPMLKIDIESLNRDERKFIQSNCEIVSFVKCKAVVYGHVGRIEDESDSVIQYEGIVLDQVDIKPDALDSYPKL